MRRNIYVHSLIFTISLILLFSIIKSELNSQIYAQSRIIDPMLSGIKSFALSPSENNILIGGTDGTLNLYNFQTGQLINQVQPLSSQSQIFKILWENNKYGLITIYNDKILRRSFVIQRDITSLEQIYRWSFKELINAADSTSDIYNSYFAIHLPNVTLEYDMRSRIMKAYFYMTYFNRVDVGLAYVADHRTLFLTANIQYMMIMDCDINFAYFWGNNQAISHRLAVDKNQHMRAPLIIKSYIDGFQVFDEQYQDYYNATFPTTPIDYFKYCPTDFILGVTPENIIKIYTRDYKFTRLSQIDQFQKQQLKITQIQCDKGYIFVSASDNKIYTFKLLPNQQQSNYELIFILIGVGIIIIILISIFIIRKIRLKTINQQSSREQIFMTLNSSEIVYALK